MNQRIDHSNYEAWLLDRMEGNLTTEQEKELDAFLAAHPELMPVDDELPTVTSVRERLSALEKESLKRSLPPTGMPTKTTIDDHLIARLEGDLRPDQLEALRIYLLDHPEHQRAERLFAITKLVPEALAYVAKRELERHVPPHGTPTRHTLTDFLVARLEGDLTPEQERALEQFIQQDPQAQREWALVLATRTVAAPLAYAAKQELKKGGRVIAIGASTWMVRLAAAASVALLLGLGLWYLRGPRIDAPEMVNVQPVQKEPAQPEQKVLQPFGAEEKNDTNVAVDMMENGVHQDPVNIGSRPAQQPAPVAPKPVPVMQEDALPVALEEPVSPRSQGSAPLVAPVLVPTPEAPIAHVQPPIKRATAATVPSNSVGEMLAATVRGRVLGEPDGDTRPLNGTDAVAMVDRSLKAVGGDHAGLEVGSKGNGHGRSFHLRLGRNFGISASK